MKSAPLLPLLLTLFAVPMHVQAYEFGLRYYRIQDPQLAETLDQIDDRYDEREKPLKKIRRSSGYNTPEHEDATRKLDALRENRDREFLRALETVAPVIQYRTSLHPGENFEDSTVVGGKPLEISLKLLKKDGNKIPVEIDADFDGDKLYQGSALLVPLSTPYVVTKAFIKIQGKGQGSLLFIEIRP